MQEDFARYLDQIIPPLLNQSALKDNKSSSYSAEMEADLQVADKRNQAINNSLDNYEMKSN